MNKQLKDTIYHVIWTICGVIIMYGMKVGWDLGCFGTYGNAIFYALMILSSVSLAMGICPFLEEFGRCYSEVEESLKD